MRDEAGGSSHPRVLVVEDDPGIADAVLYALERDGMTAVVAPSVAAARAADAGVDLAILDLGLPDGSGFTLLSEWRARGGGPAVIVLTSRDAEIDCVASLEAGADDFVAKPFSPRALVARVRAVLRRGRATTSSPPATGTPALALDPERRLATYAGRTMELTKLEFDLLAALASRPGRVHTRDQLVERVWGGDHVLTERTVDSHVKALRRKLGEAGAAPTLITAVRGVGFKLCEAP
jgi:two-component system catabolic regulation response regulator CreB